MNHDLEVSMRVPRLASARLRVVVAISFLFLATTQSFGQATTLDLVMAGRPATTGNLISLNAEAAKFKSDDDTKTIPLVELVRYGNPVDVRRGRYLILSDQSRIACTVSSIDRDRIVFSSTRSPGFWMQSEVTRGQVVLVAFSPPASPSERDFWELDCIVATAERDVLHLVGGDSLSGDVIEYIAGDGVVSEHCRFQVEATNEPITVPGDRIAAIAFKASKQAPPTTAGTWIGLSDGSVVMAEKIELLVDRLELRLACGAQLYAKLVDDATEPPDQLWDHVCFLQPIAAGQYLSDAKTIGYKHVPLVNWELPEQYDRSVRKTRLRAGGRSFQKGIGVPTTSRLAYDIPRDAKSLEALVAIDALAGKQGSVVFRVFLDAGQGQWKAAYESPIVRGGETPRPIKVELLGARRLALVADMAERGDTNDDADWLDVRFVK